MYLITITDKDHQRELLKVQTFTRSIARAVKLLEKENDIAVDVVVEVLPREVKFKDV